MPARTRLYALVMLGVLFACLLSYLYVDRPVANFMRFELERDIRRFFRTITDMGKAEYYLVPSAIVFLLFRGLFVSAAPKRISYLYYRIADMALFVFASLAISGIVVTILKPLVGRLRPRHFLNDGDPLYTFMPGFNEFSNTSFPSGHTQTVMAAAAAFTILFPRYWFIFVPYGLILAASRVFVTAHYVSDVIMGGAIAIITTLIVKQAWFERLDTPVYPAAARPGHHDTRLTAS